MEKFTDESAAKTLNLFKICAQEFATKKDLAVFAGSMAALGIALLRGIEGDEFVSGFLKGAIEEKNPLKITPELVQ